MTETANFGIINKSTPVGTKFVMGGEMLVYNGINAAGHVSILQEGGTPFVVDYTAETWNDEFAELVEEVIEPEDLQSDEPESDVPATRKMTKEQELELFERRREIREARSKFEDQHDYAKALKKRWETLQDDCDDWLDLIDAENTSVNGFPADTPLAKTTEGESWRDVHLTDLENPAIKPSVVKALNENNPPIITLGELADWQEKKGDFWIKDIPNFGASGADNIEEATTALYARIAGESNV